MALPLGVPGELVLGAARLGPDRVPASHQRPTWSPHHSWANPTGMIVTRRDTFRGREQAARLPEMDINDPFGSSNDSWRWPSGQCPPAAHVPLPTYLVRLLSPALPQPPHQACREKRKKPLDAPSRTPLHVACAPPPQAAALGALQTAEGTDDCPVFKGQCASGSSTGPWRRGPVTPGTCSRPLGPSVLS